MIEADNNWAWPWWTIMIIINIINVIVCVIFYRNSCQQEKLSKEQSECIGFTDIDSRYRKWMRNMGLIFTLVGAYRAIFVSRYLTQMAWFDSIANSSLIIRTLAIAAELSFAGLIAFAMLRVNAELPAVKYKSKLWTFMATKSPYLLCLCIFLAQFFATGGLITKNITLFAIEETLWTLGFLAILPLSIIQIRSVSKLKHPIDTEQMKLMGRFVKLNVSWCIIYCCYGLFYHLPFENWPSAIEQIKTGIPAIKSGFDAISDAFFIVNESKNYSDWGFGFLLWHSAYFTICVWISIFLMQAPGIKNNSIKA